MFMTKRKTQDTERSRQDTLNNISWFGVEVESSRVSIRPRKHRKLDQFGSRRVMAETFRCFLDYLGLHGGSLVWCSRLSCCWKGTKKNNIDICCCLLWSHGTFIRNRRRKKKWIVMLVGRQGCFWLLLFFVPLSPLRFTSSSSSFVDSKDIFQRITIKFKLNFSDA